MKKFLLALAAFAAASFTLAADQKAPVADKTKPEAKADAKCDDGSCCDDDAKPADAKATKPADAKKDDAVKKDAAKPADKK